MHFFTVSSSSALVLLTCFVSACGTAPTEATPRAPVPRVCRDAPLARSGTEPTVVPADIEKNLFFVPLTMGGVSSYAMVDTGAPFNYLNADAFPNSAIAVNSFGTAEPMQVGGLTFSSPRAARGPLATTLRGSPLPMILGAEVLCHFEASFDARAGQVILGTAVEPAEVEAPDGVAMQIAGGTNDYSATRLIVPVEIEGVAHRFLLDTGASQVVVATRVFDTIVSDGRIALPGSVVSVGGAATSSWSRVKSFKIGEVALSNQLVTTGMDAFLDTVSREVGFAVEGVVGGSALREFFVTIDYANQEVRLRRYTTTAHWADEAAVLGFSLRTAGTPGSVRYFVDAVAPGSDAARQGITVGTEIVALNEVPLATMTPAALERALHGHVGDVVTVKTDKADVSVAVLDVLALK